MVTTGLMVRFEAKEDRVAEVEATLTGGAEQVREEGLAVAGVGRSQTTTDTQEQA